MNRSKWSTILASVFDYRETGFLRGLVYSLIAVAVAFAVNLLLGRGLSFALGVAGIILFIHWLYFFYYRFAVAYRKLNG